MEIALTTLSSRGQIVLPLEMRGSLKIGDQFVVIRENDQFILKPVKNFRKNVEKELKAAQRSDAVVEEYLKNPSKFTSMSFEEFKKESMKW